MRTVLAILSLTLLAGPAAGQTVTLPRNDVALTIGWGGTHYRLPQVYSQWHQSLLAGASGSHYWTDHARTELEVAWLSRVSAPAYESVSINGGTSYIQTDYELQNFKLSLSQGYQLGRNQWVHPHFAAGADVDYVRETEDQAAQRRTIYVGSTPQGFLDTPATREIRTSLRVHPFAKAGFKFYLSDRAFLTTEWKFAFGDQLKHVVWRSGIGFDF